MHIGKHHYRQVNILGFIILLMVGLGFKLLFIEHPLESDDTTYMKLAELVSAESFSHPETQLYFRTGILLPLYLLIKIFGYSIYTYYLFSIGFSLLLLFSILLLSKELFGIKISWLTGILYVSSYLIGFQSTNLLPDTPAFFWAAISLYLSVRYMSGNGKKYFLILSALAGFMAYLCKEPILVFFAAIPVFELFRNKSVKYSLRFAACMAGLWLAESFTYFLLTGDFLIRLKTFSTGVSDWIINQPEVSPGKFLAEPITNILKSTNGIILLSMGIIGSIQVIIKKNGKVMALLTGGILVFIVYSYSFYSLHPLIPSLPPQLRYITGFFCMLTIVAGWALFTLYQYFKKIVAAPYLRPVFGMMILAIFIVQTIEYGSNKNTVLFYNDRYFEANRLLKEKFPIPVQDIIYTIPLKDFRMYSNFSKLNLTSFTTLPETPCYLLYSKKKIETSLYYAENRNKIPMIDFYRHILNHDDSLKILDYNGIVLSYVRSFSSMDKLNKQE